VAHSFGYPATFAVSAVFALAGLGLLRLRVPDDRPRRRAVAEIECPPAESGHL
jgi:predicted MFS family arabinose efflux permease